MKRSLAATSLVLFGLSLFFLIGLTAFESALIQFSAGAERGLSFLLLVVPAAIGAGLGVISLKRKERPAWMAVLGVLLNTLFALFHLMILGFAG